eukprot:CAMPEP_0203796218 /NCGR_PEP_ID=MMETSP0100_2-20121128/7766_1 /ASSEMBLY_ACC=CAM_ASM_000210 /TAXON_ID=96639 /ORGANISM=" , Strain NY0313808BC1" /LENGTH=518 /DNA_ID=CAMNT_0050701019 /DNA_START=431 /DNA_END=1987 /DNA_ORIENTATION=+
MSEYSRTRRKLTSGRQGLEQEDAMEKGGNGRNGLVASEVEQANRQALGEDSEDTDEANSSGIDESRREKGFTMLFCVPQAMSLREQPNREYVRSHILLPVEESKGDFRTLDGNSVEIKGSRLLVANPGDEIIDAFDMSPACKPSKVYPPWEKRMVHIMYTEDIPYWDVCNKPYTLKILHIDRPLRGGCNVPCTLEGMSLSLVGQYMCLLRCFPENEHLFNQLDEFVEFVIRKNGRVFPSDFQPDGHKKNDRILQHYSADEEEMFEHVRKLVRYWIRATSRTIMHQSDSFKGLFETSLNNYLVAGDEGSDCCSPTPALATPRTPSKLSSQVKRHTMQMQQVIEGYVMDRLHGVLMGQVEMRYMDEDDELFRLAKEIRSANDIQTRLGIRKEYQCAQTMAVGYLSQLGEKRTPLEKLLCLEDVVAAINASVEENIRAHFDDISAFQLTTDDLLDQLIFVVVTANGMGLKNLIAQIQFIREYHTINVNTTMLGYNLANIEVAVKWIMASGARGSEHGFPFP